MPFLCNNDKQINPVNDFDPHRVFDACRPEQVFAKW